MSLSLWAVVPVIVGPLQTLLALLPAILAALGSLLVALFRPSGLKKLARFLWHQKLFTAVLLAIGLAVWSGYPGRLLRARGLGGRVESGAVTEWSAFAGGPARHGAGPSQLDPTVPSEVWTFSDVPAVYCSPAVSGDRVYISTVEGISAFSRTGRGAIVCVDAHSGREIWRYAPDGFRATFSSPVVAAGCVICGEGLHEVRDARVTCLDLSGRRLWELQTKSHVEATACVDGERVFVGAGDDGLYCVAVQPRADGSPHVLWHLPPERYADCESSPVAGDGLVYFGLGEGGHALCAVDAVSGQERWRVETPYAVFAPPTLAAGRVFVGLGNGNFVQTAEEVREQKLAQLRDAGASAAEIEAASAKLGPAGAVWCVDARDGKVEWKFPLPDTVLGAIACRDERLHFVARDGAAYCLSLAGKQLLRRDLHEPLVSSPALGREHLYCTTANGRLFGLRLADLQPVWDVQLGSGTFFPSSPTLGHGHVYVGTPENGLRCLGEPGEPLAPLWTASMSTDAEPLPETPAIRWQAGGWQAAEPAGNDETRLLPFAGALFAGHGSRVVRFETIDADDKRPTWSVDLAGAVEGPFHGLGERLFVTTRDSLHCLATADGAVLWRTAIAEESEVALDRRQAVVWNGDTLRALDPATGRPLWTAAFSGESGRARPVLAADLVLVATDRSLAALDAGTGTLLWRTTANAPSAPQPVGNDFLIVEANDKPEAARIVRRRITDGGVVWTQATPPLHGPLLLGTEQGIAWTKSRDVLLLTLSDGAVVSRAKSSTVPFVDGTRVLLGQDAALAWLDIASGENTPWWEATDTGLPTSALVAAKGRLYFAADGKVVALGPGLDRKMAQ